MRPCLRILPPAEALLPSFTVRTDDVVLLHVFVAAAFAYAGRLQRRMPVEVAVVFHGQVSDSALLQKQIVSDLVAPHYPEDPERYKRYARYAVTPVTPLRPLRLLRLLRFRLLNVPK